MNNNLALYGENGLPVWGTKSLVFDGNSINGGYQTAYKTDISTSFDGAELTFECRFKSTDSSGGLFCISSGAILKNGAYFATANTYQATEAYMSMCISSGKLVAEYRFGSALTEQIVTVNTNTWYTLCVTYSASTGLMTVYLDGLEVTSFVVGTSALAIPYLNVGCYYYKVSITSYCRYRTFNGEIAAFRMYDRILTVAEIENNYAVDVARL